ncbi:MAG: hypothetical protein Q4D56_05770 [Bacteroides sp.]|nr:hypothetical protein [Bacteroides sp.]
MKFIYTDNWFAKLVLFGNYCTIMLFGFILTKHDVLPEEEERHERTHQVQFIECAAVAVVPALVLTILISAWWLLLIPTAYYLWYCIEYAIIRILGIKKSVEQSEAYHDVSFEEEANAGEADADYLKNRKLFAWWSYIRIGSYKEEEGGEA